MAFGVTLFAQDVITVGSESAIPGATAQVPLFIRDLAGTPLGGDAAVQNRIQAVALKISCSPPSAVSSMSIVRAGVTQSLTALYETTVTSPGAIGWLVSFAGATNPIPLTTDSADPGDRVATLSVTISESATPGTIVALSIATSTAALSNQTGTTVETTADGTLAVTNGSLNVIAPTATTLTSLPNPAAPGDTVTLTAVVSSAIAGTISGSVTFNDGATTLATVPVSSGQAQFSTAALAAGLHAITAVYSGDPNFAASTSASVSQSIASPPTGVVATASSDTEVHVTWTALSGVDHYDVYRSSAGGAYQFAGTSGTATEFPDGPVATETTHLYYVRAIMTNAATSPNSAIDPATTIVFVDDVLQSNVTTVKAVHIEQLRKAVNAFRIAAGLAGIATNAPTGEQIAASHITSLRSSLAEARSLLGLSGLTYLQPSPDAGTTPIKRNEVEELRGGVQ